MRLRRFSDVNRGLFGISRVEKNYVCWLFKGGLATSRVSYELRSKHGFWTWRKMVPISFNRMFFIHKYIEALLWRNYGYFSMTPKKSVLVAEIFLFFVCVFQRDYWKWASMGDSVNRVRYKLLQLFPYWKVESGNKLRGRNCPRTVFHSDSRRNENGDVHKGRYDRFCSEEYMNWVSYRRSDRRWASRCPGRRCCYHRRRPPLSGRGGWRLWRQSWGPSCAWSCPKWWACRNLPGERRRSPSAASAGCGGPRASEGSPAICAPCVTKAHRRERLVDR